MLDGRPGHGKVVGGSSLGRDGCVEAFTVGRDVRKRGGLDRGVRIAAGLESLEKRLESARYRHKTNKPCE